MTKAPRRRSVVSARISAARKDASSLKNAQIIDRVAGRTAVPTAGKTILSIDPGGTTGVAIRFPDTTWMTASVTTPSQLWDFFMERPDEVVFEIFATAGRVDHWMIYTIELVGGMKALIYGLNLHGFAHSPGFRYPFLKQAEAMLKGQEHTVHEVDALAHLLAHEGRPK